MATISIRAKTSILYNKTPELKEKEKLYYVSTPLEIKHCPEDKKPTTMKEFLEVCKTYTEVVINTKTKKVGGWNHECYRCLFSKPKAAQNAYDKTFKQIQTAKQKAAAEEYAKGKWAEEAAGWVEDEAE